MSSLAACFAAATLLVAWNEIKDLRARLSVRQEIIDHLNAENWSRSRDLRVFADLSSTLYDRLRAGGGESFGPRWWTEGEE